MRHSLRTFCFATVLIAASAQAADDIERLARNIYDQSIVPAPSAEAVKKNLALLRPDGSYMDIDYASTARAGWSPQSHFTRLNELANAWCDPNSPYYRDAALKNAIITSYGYFLDRDPQSTNWFFSVIAVPQRLGSLMLKMQQNGFLPKENFAKGIALVHRSAKGQGGASTGANLGSQAACTIHEGVLRYRAPGASASEKAAASALIQKSYEYIGSTLATALDLEDDGIRIDSSYQSHQQTLYDGGYGGTLLGRAAQVAAWGAGTSYGLSPANTRLMVNYILDGGPQWMVRGLTYDPLASGRYWSRAAQIDSAATLRAPIETALAICGDYRRTELITLRDRLADSIANNIASPTLGPTGNRAYWISDYMVQQRPGYMISVNSASKRTNTPESINGENLKAGYGTAGVNLIFRSGREYDGIYAAWDWYRLPGTTSERSTDGTGGSYNILPDHHFGTTDFVGGASDGNTGAFIYQMSEYNVTANKAYFFIDSGMVALGSLIKQAKPNSLGGKIGTTVNQTRLLGPVTFAETDGRTSTIEPGQTVQTSKLNWVNHDSVAYLSLAPGQSSTIRAVKQRGSWKSINESGPSDAVEVDVFSLDFDHGSLPSAGSYAYAVVPNTKADQTAALANAKPFEVLRNDADVQAVGDRASGTTQVIFHNSVSVRLNDKVELSPLGRVAGTVVLWTPSEKGIKLSVANADRQNKQVAFKVSAKLTGQGASYDAATGLTTLTFTLPSGYRAGSTMTRSYEWSAGNEAQQKSQ